MMRGKRVEFYFILLKSVIRILCNSQRNVFDLTCLIPLLLYYLYHESEEKIPGGNEEKPSENTPQKVCHFVHVVSINDYNKSKLQRPKPLISLNARLIWRFEDTDEDGTDELYLDYYDGTGRRDPFELTKNTETGEYYFEYPVGVYLKLKSAGGGMYELIDGSGSRMEFTRYDVPETFLLSGIEDRHGNRLDVLRSVDGKLFDSKICDLCWWNPFNHSWNIFWIN